MRNLVCSLRNTKTRIDKGIDKVNVKTWLCLIFLGIGYLVYKSFDKKESVVQVVNKYYTLKGIDTVLIKDTFYLTKSVKTKFVKTKKVNYSNIELYSKGINVNTEQKIYTHLSKCN